MGRPSLSQGRLEAVQADAASAVLDILEAGEKLTVAGVAKRLGLSPMALYRYFPAGREEMVVHARALGFRRFGDLLAEAGDPKRAENIEDHIVELGRVALRFSREMPETYRVIYTEVQPTWEKEEPLRSVRAHVIGAYVFDAFEAMEGPLSMPPELAAHGFTALCHGVIMYEMSQQPYAGRHGDLLLEPAIRAYLGGLARPEH